MTALTCALIVAGILSMLFANTRGIGIICITALCILYPIPVIAAGLIGGGVWYYMKKAP